MSDEILSGKLKVPEEDLTEIIQKEENVKMLIEDAKKMLISEPEECLGGWSLINADPQYVCVFKKIILSEPSVTLSLSYKGFI